MNAFTHLLRSRSSLRFLILLAPLLFAACSKKEPDAPSSTTLERASLMQLAFPGWAASGPSQKQKLHITADFSQKTDAQGKAQDDIEERSLEPQFVVRLSDDDATLIFRSHKLDEHGEVDLCMGCVVDYGAVQFHRRDDKWYLSNRQDVFMATGDRGSGDTPEIIKLAQHVFALKVTEVAEQMGEEDDMVDLYELTPAGPHELLDKNITGSYNIDGATPVDCTDPTVLDKGKEFKPEEDTQCAHIDMKWHLDASAETRGDLTLKFSGLVRNQGKDKQYHFHRIDAQQVWRYQGGKYVVLSGENPVETLDR